MGAACEKMTEKVFKDMDGYEETATKRASAHSGQTCCRLSNKEGFSPAQWVLGECVRLPASCVDLQNHPVVVGQGVEWSSFWLRL